MISLNKLVINNLSTIVIDEADNMVNEKENDDIFNIITLIPQTCQKILISATLTQYVFNLTDKIMKDPVKTIDGFTYERSAIETWFTHRISSPLTGLELSSSTLISNTELANLIADFIKTRFQIQLLE